MGWDGMGWGGLLACHGMAWEIVDVSVFVIRGKRWAGWLGFVY